MVFEWLFLLFWRRDDLLAKMRGRIKTAGREKREEQAEEEQKTIKPPPTQ